MKRLLLLVSIGLVAAFGINTATASASSCNTNVDHIYWDGALAFRAIIAGCVGVDKVQYGLGSPAGQTGIVAYNTGIMHGAYNGQGYVVNNCAGQCFTIYHVGTWSMPSPVFQAVYSQFTYRIHNSSAPPNTWGPWHIGLPYAGEWINA